MKIKEIYSFLDSIAPFDTAEEWDNVGLLVGDGDTDVSCAVVALDCTPDAIRVAQDMGANLIITHHPVVFGQEPDAPPTPLELLLREKGIAAISAHTNLDKAQNGVNSLLCATLGLCAHPADEEPSLMVSELQDPQIFEEFLDCIKSKLGIGYLRAHKATDLVQKVAVCCGSGGDLLSLAHSLGCDTLLTGDVKHNVFVEADHSDMNLIDAGHYATENLIVEVLADMLRRRFDNVDFITSHTEPFCVY